MTNKPIGTRQEIKSRLQQETIRIIDKLAKLHDCKNKTAARIFFILTYTKKKETGFTMSNFHNFYHSYRKVVRRRNKKEKAQNKG